jgi:hypothetical protein
VSRARQVLGARAGAWVRRSGSALLFTLATLCVVLGPSIASAQLNLSWVDNSGGQAGFILQRAQGTTGAYGQIAQTPPGVTSYADATGSPGTTYCYQVAAFNSAGVSAFSNVACGTLAGGGGFTITASDGGTGIGTIASSPTGINCGTLCSATYPTGATVTLTATPASGSAFSGWSGGWCSGKGPCSVAGAGSVTISAMFVGLYTLSVGTQGPGTVSSSPAGISCGSTCSASYASGSVVSLTAVPGRGAHFSGWSGGGCSGTGTCSVTLNAAMSVTASFSKSGKK